MKNIVHFSLIIFHFFLVGLGGFEPPTSPLSGVRSNQLSYRPGIFKPGLHLVVKKVAVNDSD